MKQPKRYDASHPMVRERTGDPARGHWMPKEKRQKPSKRGRRR